MSGDLPSPYLYGVEDSNELMWIVAQAACESVGITLAQLFSHAKADKWPDDERVESIWLCFGPPLLKEMELIEKELARG